MMHGIPASGMEAQMDRIVDRISIQSLFSKMPMQTPQEGERFALVVGGVAVNMRDRAQRRGECFLQTAARVAESARPVCPREALEGQ